MPFSNAIPLPGGRVGYDVRDVIAALKQADIVRVDWPEPDGRTKVMEVIGFSLAADPNVLELAVRNEAQAFALREAKIAIDGGNMLDAYRALRRLAEPDIQLPS